MKRGWAVGAALLAAAGVASASGDKPQYVNWDTAKAQAAATGKPILVYSTVDAKGNGC